MGVGQLTQVAAASVDEVTEPLVKPSLRRQRLLGPVIGLVAVQVALWVWAAFSATYYQDDWPLAYSALDHPMLSRDWLLLDNNGYVAPVAGILVWLTVHVNPFDYHTALLVTVVLGLVMDWSAWVCLRTYLGVRRVTVLWWAVVVLSPLWLVVVGWWTVGTSVLPACIASAWMLVGVHRYRDTHRLRWAALTVGAYAVALLATPKAALLGVFLAAFVLVVLTSGSLLARLGEVARRWVPVWVGGLVVSGLWLWGYTRLGASRSTELSVLSNAWALVRESLLGTFVPSLGGGPWSVEPGPVPFPPFGPLPTWVVLLVLEVAVLVVLVARWAHRGPWLPLVPLGVMAVGNLVLLSWAAVAWFGPEVTRQGRYWTDVLLPAVLCLALAATPRRAPRDAPLPRLVRRRPWVAPVAFGLTLLVLANSAVLTIARTGDVMRSGTGAAYLDTLVRDLDQHPTATIFDTSMPSEIINVYLFPSDGYVSRAMRHWLTDQTFDTPTEKYTVVDEDGRLRDGKLLPTTTSVPGPQGSCGYLATSKPATIRFPGEQYAWKWVVQLSYLANSDFEATARVGSTVVKLPVRRGLHQIYFVAVTSFRDIVVTTPSADQGMCIDFAAVGNLAAA